MEHARFRVIAFATGWGSEFGGINVFNFQFLEQLAFACRGRVGVVCVVPTLPFNQEPARDVKLVQLPYTPVGGKFEATHAQAAIHQLRSENVSLEPEGLVWLGHDRVTGEIALQARNLAGGRAALVHHMSYQHYEAFADSSSSANAKSELQKRLFRSADVRMAIGPLLRDSLKDMVRNAPVTMLVPGQDEIDFVSAPKKFVAFMSGRLSADTTKIKQGHLGVAAFAEAQRRASTETGLAESLKNQPRLILRGVDMEPEVPPPATPNVEYWARFAAECAGRVVNIHALAYTKQRNALLEELAEATVALMPSWHEGFGLVGWEAVAAGVPLILTEQSGLHQFLKEESDEGWLNWVYPVDVHGNVDSPYFHANDLKQVSDHLIEIAKDPNAARSKAARLRAAVSIYTWKRCVDTALEGLGWSAVEISRGETPLPARVPVALAPPAPPSASPLELPESRWQPGSGLADSQLLRAEEAAVAFDPAREPEIARLMDWAHDPEYPQALRLITASGGSGKTRLALELCTRLINDGWQCGFMRSEIGAGKVLGAWSEMDARDMPILAVFDYAETRQETLLAFLRAMLQARRRQVRPPVRILLLARDGGEWWEQLPSRDSTVEPFLSGYASSGPVALLPLHRGNKAREAAFQAALGAYADRMGVSEMPHLDVDLTGDHFERPLYIQMAALLALHGERPASAEGLTNALLHHERRYWTRLVHDGLSPAGLTELDDRHAAELMTLATLASGFLRSVDARKVWEAWDGSLGRELSAPQQRALFERLVPLYPGQQGLQPLRPDLLGEALVAYSLLQPSGERLLDALLSSANDATQRRSALTVVARLSMHRSDVENVVVQSLARKFVPCAPDLVNVATQMDSQLPNWAEKAFARLSPPDRAQAVGVLRPWIRHESVQLAQLACAVSEAEVAKMKAKFERKPADLDVRADYARALSDLSVDLNRLGKSGLLEGTQSVELFTKLAAKFPSRFEPELATALLNYADYLSEEGHAAKALVEVKKAVEIYQRLAAKNANRYEPYLAVSLSNHAVRLLDDGQVAESLIEAEKALEIQKRLVAEDADRFEPELARAVGIYANSLHTNGATAEALIELEKALGIYKRLVARNADRFEPELAASLYMFAILLADSGQFAKALLCAEEVREIYLRLAANRPMRFGEDAYLGSLTVQWFAWLARDAKRDASMNRPSPDEAWSKPHRLPLLNLYPLWLEACWADANGARAVALDHMMKAAEELTAPLFREVEPYWLCASAWRAAHAPDAASGPRESQWRLLWEGFVRGREGQLPQWMNEAAARLDFQWPPTGAVTPTTAPGFRRA